MEVEIINEKLLYLKTLMKKLYSLLEEYELENDLNRKDTLFAAMTKYSEEIIEVAIKINNKLLEKKSDYASTYYQTFLKVEKYYSFPKSNLKLLGQTTSLRNKAAHEYEFLFENKDNSIKKYKDLLKLYPNYIEDIKEIIRTQY